MKIRYSQITALFVLLSTIGFAQAERVVTKTVPLDKDGRVFIDTYKGSIRVEVWDNDEVYLEARIELDDGDDDDAQDAVDLVDIEIASRSSSFRVETSYDRLKNRRHRRWSFWQTELPSVHYTLRIPSQASLMIEDYKSTTRVRGLSSDLTFETYKGDAKITDHDGEVSVETYKGDVSIAFRSEPHSGRFETYKGDISVEVPDEAGFDVRFDLGRRADLRSYVDFDDSGSFSRRGSRRFRDTVHGGGPTLSFESSKGSIRLTSH